MNNVRLSLLALSTALLSMGCAAQKKLPASSPPKDTAVSDSTKKPGAGMKKGEPQPYDKVITDKAISATGFFKVHR